MHAPSEYGQVPWVAVPAVLSNPMRRIVSQEHCGMIGSQEKGQHLPGQHQNACTVRHQSCFAPAYTIAPTRHVAHVTTMDR